MGLIHTFPPYDDESGLGYYRRLTAANALRGWKELAGVANVPRNRASWLNQMADIAHVLGLEQSWAQSAANQELEVRRYKSLHRTSHDAVCPQCLGSDVYLRRHWEHAYLTACPIHHCLLQEQCQNCGSHLPTTRNQIEICECGFDLRALQVVKASPAQVWLSTLIADGGPDSLGILPNPQSVNVMALCDLVKLLCRHMDPLKAPKRLNESSAKHVRHSVEFLAPLDSLLIDWPISFEAHVAHRIAVGDQNARTLNTLLGSWYAHMKKTCLGNGLSVFRNAVVRVAMRDFNGSLGLDLGPEDFAESRNFMPVVAAAKSLGISRDTLIKAIKFGECAHRTRRFGTRGLAYEVPVEQVEHIASQRRVWVNEETACEMALVPPSVMRNMVEARVVESDVRWRNDIRKGGPINLPSLLSVHTTLNSLAGKHTGSSEEWIEWAELTSRRQGDNKAIQAVMAAAASGKLRAVVPGRRLGQTGFLKSDVTPYFGTPLLEAGMSVQHLAKVTGWKWESISHWLEEGLLSSESINLRGQPCRVVTPQQLLEFRQNYIPLSDLARSMKTKSAHLWERFACIDILGAKALPNGAKRGGLIRVADLGRLAIAGADSLPLFRGNLGN